MVSPFISFYTPSYKRPRQLSACLASVGMQTAVDDIEQIVVVDHVGVGVHGMFARVPEYAPVVHGQYAHILADDDVLAGPDVVARLKHIAEVEQFPAVIIVSATKGHLTLPLDREGPPVCGRIDLGCLVVRADIWKQHVTDYKACYEGDFFMADALWKAQHRFVYAPELLFLRGAVSRGAAEAA
jgi:hypothetical protein